MKLYEKESDPLELVENPINGNLYYMEDGNLIKYIDDKNYSIVGLTPLIETESLISLTEKQLQLFWKIAKNKHSYAWDNL
jgi:hypothetical protein